MMSSKLANEVKDIVKKESSSGLFDFTSPAADKPATLLIVDRKSDLSTPLLLQWTYQAMIHEIFGIEDGCVDISTSNFQTSQRSVLLNSAPSSQQHNLVASQDPFFAENMHLNFAQVAENLSELTKMYQEKTNSKQKLDSLVGIKQFLEDYPAMMKLTSTLSKHLEIISALQNATKASYLLDASEAQQNILSSSESAHFLDEILSEAKVPKCLKINVSTLFALQAVKRSNSAFNLLTYFEHLRGFPSITSEDIETIDLFIKLAHHESDLQQTWGSFVSLSSTRTDENIYSFHVPPIIGLIDAAARGKLDKDLFPALPIDTRHSPAISCGQQCKELIIFIVGGTTFEEACHIDRYMKLNPGVTILIGGNTVLNAKKVMEMAISISSNLKKS